MGHHSAHDTCGEGWRSTKNHGYAGGDERCILFALNRLSVGLPAKIVPTKINGIRLFFSMALYCTAQRKALFYRQWSRGLFEKGSRLFNCTEGRSRTDTMSPSPDFESGASTNSATPAVQAQL